MNVPNQGRQFSFEQGSEHLWCKRGHANKKYNMRNPVSIMLKHEPFELVIADVGDNEFIA